MSGVQVLMVGEGEGDQRLDRWPAQALPASHPGRH
jgi:hypothetical protein